MFEWSKEAARQLLHQVGQFGVLVDMRHLEPLPADAQQHLQAGQRLFKTKGMQRSAVVLQDAIIALQFKRIARETGIDQCQRYIDASSPGWEMKANGWITAGLDPDKQSERVA
jgi:hypothetical protein